MADTGLIVTVVIFCLIFAWIITFSILAATLKKPIFEKLSIIGPLGHKIHLASNEISFADQPIHEIKKRGDITEYPNTRLRPSISDPNIRLHSSISNNKSLQPSISNDTNTTPITTPQQPDQTPEPITEGGHHPYNDETFIDPDF